MIFHLRDMVGSKNCATGLKKKSKSGGINEIWVRSVPLPFYDGLFERFRNAWKIIKGEAYPIYWPQPGELEEALSR